MKRHAFFAMAAICCAAALAASGDDGAASGENLAAATLDRAAKLWENPQRSAGDVAEVVKICEGLLANRESFQTTEEGKAMLGRIYSLMGKAYGAANGAAAASDAPRTGTVKTLDLPGHASIEMIYCEPGSFVMGSPNDEEGRDLDETQHAVTLTKGFWLSKCEVTQAQWESVMNGNPSSFKGNGKMPVDSVSWNDCHEFTRRLNALLDCEARLPTEAEWEYACRAGTKSAFSWGNALNGRKANCNGDFPCATHERGPYLRHPTPAGHYAPNPWGFFDMHGNMYEWCEDRCGDYPAGDATDPEGNTEGKCRILRGGCWYFGARFCRSANRIKNSPSYSDAFTGMRLCCGRIP